jgi:hypothetical protein
MQSTYTMISGTSDYKSPNTSNSPAVEPQPRHLLWEYLSVLGALMGISAVTITTLVFLTTTLIRTNEQDRQATLLVRPAIPSLRTIDPRAYSNDYWGQWEDQYPENIQLAALSDDRWRVSR